MRWFEKYRWDFDVWGLIVFLLATLFATGFAVCHLFFAMENFIID